MRSTADILCAASDPIFYLHHANVDRAWWSWQKRNLTERVRDISGPIVNFDWENEQAGNVSLKHPIFIGETVRLEAVIGDMMHIQRGMLCYGYDELY